MKGSTVDITGKKYGHLIALRYIHDGMWECLCICGKKNLVRRSHLQRKFKTKSCGCLRLKNIGNGNRIHGLSGSPEYLVWNAAKSRCYNKKDKGFKNYGDRGIEMYKPWIHNFMSFLEYVGKRPSQFHSLERIDNNKDYSPGNIRWASRYDQANNKRNNRLVHYNGEIRTLSQWSRISGIYQSRLRWRLEHWPIERAFSQPIKKLLRVKTKS